ncbi:Trehalose-6-P synthase/phosphatase complex synthase subunit [Asimina triloba]
MAANILFPFSSCAVATYSRAPPKVPPAAAALGTKNVRPRASYETVEPAVARRSANYQPTVWTDDFIQSLKSDYSGDVHVQRMEELQKAVGHSLKEVGGPLAKLELINDLQRLGVGRLFEREINDILNAMHTDYDEKEKERWDVRFTALYFRLLRGRGFDVSQEIFSRFMDGTGNFQTSLSNDPNGLLSLYEASYLCMPGESILDEANAFARRHLKDLKEKDIHPSIAMQVEHALELPIHWRMPRLDCRWYITMYEHKDGMNPLLLELAKLDFNTLQSIHRSELRKGSRWWSELGVAEKLSFARDRLMEDYQWAMGIVFEPQFGHCREVLTKPIQLITTIDDMYDVYGSLDELELFTDAVARWNINAMESLPDYMKLCFLVLYNTTNEAGYEFLREHGVDIIPHLRKAWADYCKAGLQEARWVNSKYTPSLDEYLNNAWTSISGPLMLTHAFFFHGQKPSKEALHCFTTHQDLMRWSSTVFRLTDDLGTSEEEMAKGDVPKSIQCHMHEAGVPVEMAREHIKGVIRDTWRKMNKYLTDPSPLPKPFIASAFDLARTSTCVYLYGDGFGVPDGENKENIMSLLVYPIPLH